MRVRVYSLVVAAILAALVSVSVGAQSPNTYTSIMMTDVLSGAPVIGGVFTTDLQVSITNSATPEVGVMGVEIWLPFDADIVTVDDYDDNPANGIQVEVKNGFFDGTLVIGANDVYIGAGSMPPAAPAACYGFANSGCVHVAVSHTGGSGPVTNGSGSVATITWGGLNAGPTGISVAVVGDGQPPGSVLSDPDGNPIPINSVSVPGITIVTGGTIQGIVWRQGVQNGHAGTEVVAFELGDGTMATGQTLSDGTFFLSPLPAPEYIVHATYPGYLKSQKNSVYVVGATVDIGPTTLVGGDVNADNCINILDIVSIISKFGQTSLPADDPYDINNDGTINILDLTVTAGNFTRCGPTTWTP